MELDQLECGLDHIADLVHVLDCFELSINIDWCGNIIKMRICSYMFIYQKVYMWLPNWPGYILRSMVNK